MANKRSKRKLDDPSRHKDNLSWHELLADEYASKEEPPADGYKTCEQIANELSKSVSYTSFILRRLEKRGKVDVRKFKIKTGSKYYPVPHYKINDQEEL
jgi:hypothetical protein